VPLDEVIRATAHVAPASVVVAATSGCGLDRGDGMAQVVGLPQLRPPTTPTDAGSDLVVHLRPPSDDTVTRAPVTPATVVMHQPGVGQEMNAGELPDVGIERTCLKVCPKFVLLSMTTW
jgi:hypothetical protein